MRKHLIRVVIKTWEFQKAHKCFELTFSMKLYISLIQRGMMPGASAFPIIVWVFPDVVCPYAITVPEHCKNNRNIVMSRSAIHNYDSHCRYFPSHQTDWGLRSFAVAGPSSWNVLPVGLRSSSFSLETFAKHLKTNLFGFTYSRQSTHSWVCITFCKVRHCDSVTKPDYYY